MGVDVDRHALEIFRNSLGLEAEWVDLDSEALPFDDNSFDVVVCTEVMEHLRFPDHALAEISRVLRHGVRFIGSVPNAFRLRNRLRFLAGKPFEDDSTHLRTYSVELLRETLEREFEYIEIHPVSGHLLGGGIEAELELAWDRQGSEAVLETTFDQVGLVFGRGGWEVEAGIKYETQAGRGLLVEEARIQVGKTDAFPWYIQVGRTVVLFGEHDSRFVEDPLTAILGETDDDAFLVGFDDEQMHIAGGIYRGKLNADGDLDFVMSAKAGAVGILGFGVSWSSDLGESVELREIHNGYLEESLAEQSSGTLASADGYRPSQVQGISGFTILDLDIVQLRFEYVSALASFPAGFILENIVLPSAWVLESAWRPVGRWVFAGRIEATSDLAGTAERQFGVATTYLLSDRIMVTADYLLGMFAGEVPDGQVLDFMRSLGF